MAKDYIGDWAGFFDQIRGRKKFLGKHRMICRISPATNGQLSVVIYWPDIGVDTVTGAQGALTHAAKGHIVRNAIRFTEDHLIAGQAASSSREGVVLGGEYVAQLVGDDRLEGNFTFGPPPQPHAGKIGGSFALERVTALG